MQDIRIIYSLHRPFQKPLKTVKWVCQFVDRMDKKGKLPKPSLFYFDFFFYLIDKLYKEYKKSQEQEIEIEGLIPSRETIVEIHDFFLAISRKKRSEYLKKVLSKKREKGIEKQIYSTYKAISYYINLAKDKFGLLDQKYHLSENGKKMCETYSSFFVLGQKEKAICFDCILDCDIHAFVSLSLLFKSSKKYSLLTQNILFDFLKHHYKIPKFDYTTPSLGNYTEVRHYWIETLNILDSNSNIRKKYISTLNKNIKYKAIFEDIQHNVSLYEQEKIKGIDKYVSNKEKFLKAYNECIKLGLSESKYVNLHDIKTSMKMSHSKFESFLNEFYEKEKKDISIFFSNIVSSIDNRKRFYVREYPILKIKMIKK